MYMPVLISMEQTTGIKTVVFFCVIQWQPPIQRQNSSTPYTILWMTPNSTSTKKSVCSTPSMTTSDSKGQHIKQGPVFFQIYLLHLNNG